MLELAVASGPVPLHFELQLELQLEVELELVLELVAATGPLPLHAALQHTTLGGRGRSCTWASRQNRPPAGHRLEMLTTML